MQDSGLLNGFNDGLHPSSGIGGGQSASEMMVEMNHNTAQEVNDDEMYVPYDLSCILKKNGFDVRCHYYYKADYVGVGSDLVNYNGFKTYISRPFYQQVSDWFRIVHKYSLNVFQEVDFGIDTNTNPKYTGKWNWEIVRVGVYDRFYDDHYGSENEYYQSWYKAVKQALTLIPDIK